MDKVQFNQQKVSMRKVVKKAKVRIIHQLTRQIQRLNKKSGSEQQVEKNKRRSARLGAEIEALKKFTIDQITAAAVITTETYEDVCKKPDASAEERAMARFANYDVIKKKVAEFKDLVKPEFLRIGKRSKRKMNRELREAMAKKEDEEGSNDEEGSDGGSDAEDSEENVDGNKSVGNLEDKLRAEPDDNEEEEEDGEDENEGDIEAQSDEEKSDLSVIKKSMSPSKSVKLISNRTKTQGRDTVKPVQTKKPPPKATPTAVADQESVPSVRKQPKKSSFFASVKEGADVDPDEGISSGDDDKEAKSKELANKFKNISAELKMNTSIKDFLRTRTAEGKKSLDSVFMGRLSDTKPMKKQQQSKNRAGQRQRQRRGKMNDPDNKGAKLQAFRKQREKGLRKIAAVDQPNVVKSSERPVRLVPGVNCFRNKMGTGHDSQQSKQPQKKQEEKLHPSWEAKRRQKEQDSKIVKFEGKKITFGDD